MKNVLMMPGARKIVTMCANLQSHETALIVTDPERIRVAAALAAAVEERGVAAVTMVMPPNELDGQEPHPLVAKAMLGVDVIFTPVTRSITHSSAVKDAQGSGARVLSLTKFEDEQLYKGGIHADFLKEKPHCDAMAERLGQASDLHLTSPGGTDLRLSVQGRQGNSHPCVAHEPGQFTAIINIEANIAPVEGTAEGVIVVDGSVSNFDIGPVRQPIRLKVSKGRIVDIDGGGEAHVIAKILEDLGDEDSYNIAQIAVGMNPKCLDFNGWFLNEHGVYGSAHIGIGTSENLGGSTRAPLHFDVMMRAPTLRLDGEAVVEGGKILVKAG